jgi:4-amino-4-deoxy-L-arabinose transferase-like glycosyltransferase
MLFRRGLAAESCYIPCVREILRKHSRFFLAATLAAIVLRLFFVFRFPAITSDSRVYADIAKNWLQHGIYGLGGGAGITPTGIRLPGYPAFLVAVFAIFGVDHYRAALLLQILVDLGTCFLIADLGGRVASERAAKIAFLLAAVCPFLANYTAAALSETWEIFFTVLALDLALAGIADRENVRLGSWLGCGLAIGMAILLRPDGGLLLIAIEVYLIIVAVQVSANGRPIGPCIKSGFIVGVVSLACLIPWTFRNLHTLREFQPLAPRYANEEGTLVPTGFIRWMKTWIADYASVEEVYWAVPGNPIDVDTLPSRAFDSRQQADQTDELLDDYNHSLRITPALDASFAGLAAVRIRHAPLRYYIWLPALRIADMWLRPRTEILPCNVRWWEFDEDTQWLVLNIVLGVVNLLYIAAALLGLLRRRFAAGFAMLLIFIVLRSVFLGTLENPEPRYTLECYPIVILLAATLISRTSRLQS